MNVFFDTNVLLDVALRREPYLARSQAILSDAIENHSCFMSWHTVSNLSYILSKLEGKENALLFIRNICKVVRIAPVQHDDVDVAFKYDSGDFEDAMQIACALACNAEIIVTRDSSGFSNSPVPLSDTVED
ncbi:MAG: PIN domain-containing protein [Verrucomicrobiota bacterium]